MDAVKPPAGGETTKIRGRALKWCWGCGADIGCGADKLRPEAIGIDDDPSPHVNILCDAAHIPLPNGILDYVYSSHCLEDFADPAAALAEWSRLLKPEGRLVLYVPHPDLYHGVNLEHHFPGFRPEELRALIGGAGCEVVWIETDDRRDCGAGPGREYPAFTAECYSVFAVARKAGLTG